jgi:hypothetical protein
MEDHLETRVRLVGAGLQTTLVGIALTPVTALGFALVVVGTAITLGGIV